MLTDSPFSSNVFRAGADESSRLDSSMAMGKNLFASELRTGTAAGGSGIHALTSGLGGMSLGGKGKGKGKRSPNPFALASGSGIGAGGPGSGSGSKSRLNHKRSLPTLRHGADAGDDLLPSAPGLGKITRDWTEHESGSKTETIVTDRFLAQRSGSGVLKAPPQWGGAGESLSSIGQDRSGSKSRAPSASDAGDDTPSLLQQADAIKDAHILPTGSMTDLEEQQALNSAARSAAALGIEFSPQVLSFAPRPPGAGAGNTSAASVRQRRLLSAATNNLHSRRPIPNKPEKVLDAADVCDDFYYNLMDWSVTNQVAIALQGRAFIWDCEEAQVYELVDLAEEPERVGGNVCALISSLKWHSDGTFLVVGTDGGYAQVWDTVERRRVRTLKPSAEGGATATAICTLGWADATTLTLGYASGLVVDHDIRAADSTIRTINAHAGYACGLLWRDDGGLLATGGNDNIVKVFDRNSREPVMTRTEHQAAVKAMSWSPFNSNILATGGGSACRTVNIWNVETNARLMSWGTEAQISSLHWSWYHRELLTTHGSSDGSPSGCINLWSYPSGKVLHRIDRAHEGRILGSVLSPDGQKLASVDTGGNELRFWTVFEATEEQRRRHRQGKGLELYDPLKTDPHRARTHSLLR